MVWANRLDPMELGLVVVSDGVEELDWSMESVVIEVFDGAMEADGLIETCWPLKDVEFEEADWEAVNGSNVEVICKEKVDDAAALNFVFGSDCSRAVATSAPAGIWTADPAHPTK